MRSGETVLLGRDSQRRAIDQVVSGIREHAGASLVLAGDTGTGKTALVEYAACQRGGARVLSARGVRAEASLPFAGLYGLLGPVLELLPRIPSRQAAALSAAFALSPSTSIDQFAVSAGTLRLLAVAGQEGPLLVLVDDLHLLDVTSREALLFVARRTAAEGVGMVLATSSGAEETGLPCLPVPPLDPRASQALLERTSPGPVAPVVAEHLAMATAGTPLALVEVPTLLTARQLSGAEPLPDPLPVGPLVARAFAPRLAGLHPAERTALLVGAAAGEAGLASTLGAMAALGMRPEALEAAEAIGVVTLVGDAVVFCHPLLRAVAYHEATPAQRRAVHRALASVTPPARRAWHLGTAALGPDDEAADELERTAARRANPLAVGAAARLTERAAELTGANATRARRCVAAAELWQLAGASGRVRELLDQVPRLTDDLRIRAHGQAVLARAEVRCGRPVQSHRLLMREVARVRGTDPAAAATMLLGAADAFCLAGDLRAALVAVVRSGQLSGHAPAPLPAVFTAAHAAVLARQGNLTEARQLLASCWEEVARAVGDGEVPTGWRQSARLGFPALLARLGELDAARRFLDEAINQDDALEVHGLLPGLFVERAEISLRIGDWTGAHAGATEAARLAERVEQPPDLATALICLARLAALRGERAECDARLASAREIAGRCRLGGLAVAMGAVEGLLELGEGTDEAAYLHLERVARQVEAGSGADYGQVSWVPDFVEAAVRVGRPEEAARALAALRPHAGASAPLACAVARCSALLASGAPERHFDEALRRVPGTGEPFERARTELCYGEWLRQRGRPAAAGLRIRVALAAFEELGARPWARRAARELATVGPSRRFAGDQARPTPVRAIAGDRAAVGSGAPGLPMRCLTAQELRVAMLVGQGATNREAANALFLSTKTIEFHLRSVYRKLGVRSRAELAHLIGQGPETIAPAV
jgi:DNA-binding CsgD family transcriptional regulator